MKGHAIRIFAALAAIDLYTFRRTAPLRILEDGATIIYTA
jgi:hypothetical protein